jgi:hypothetical protein
MCWCVFSHYNFPNVLEINIAFEYLHLPISTLWRTAYVLKPDGPDEDIYFCTWLATVFIQNLPSNQSIRTSLMTVLSKSSTILENWLYSHANFLMSLTDRTSPLTLTLTWNTANIFQIKKYQEKVYMIHHITILLSIYQKISIFSLN